MPRSVDVAMVLAAVATAMTLVCEWPQVHRLRRTGDRQGVSLSTATLSVAAESGWVIYLSGEQLWSALPESILTIVVSLTLSRVLLRSGAPAAAAVGAAASWGAALVVARLVGGPPTMAVLLSVTYAVQLLPSVWAVWRTWLPSGVAPATWLVRLVQSALWGTYGAVGQDPPLLILGAIGSAASISVLARLAVTRTRRPGYSSPGVIVLALPSHHERAGAVGAVGQAA